MILTYLLFAVLVALGLAYVLRPFWRSGPQPFPQSPRPDELRTELEVIKAQAKEAEGTERKQLLVQAVRLERQLAELGNPQPNPRPLQPATLGAMAVALVLLGVGLWSFTVPRLPGETIITSNDQARQLGALKRKAEGSNTAADWLAYANAAYGLQIMDQAADAYLKVIHLEPTNPTAVRRLGILLFMSSRPKEAIQALELATEAEPGEPEGWLFLGNAYFQEGQARQAIRAWEGYLKAGGTAKERVQGLIETAKAQLAGGGGSGQQLFLQRCAACHGAQAQGGIGPRLQGNPITKVPAAVSEIVTKGRGQMAPVPLSPDELKALLAYLQGL